MFVPAQGGPRSPPFTLNQAEINRVAASLYPVHLKEAGIGGAVLVRVSVNQLGEVRSVRALRPRLFGLIPRAKPAVFHSETGERVESIEWTTHPELLDAAEKAASHGVFAPPRIRGRPAPSGVCDVIIQFWST